MYHSLYSTALAIVYRPQYTPFRWILFTHTLDFTKFNRIENLVFDCHNYIHAVLELWTGSISTCNCKQYNCNIWCSLCWFLTFCVRIIIDISHIDSNNISENGMLQLAWKMFTARLQLGSEQLKFHVKCTYAQPRSPRQGKPIASRTTSSTIDNLPLIPIGVSTRSETESCGVYMKLSGRGSNAPYCCLWEWMYWLRRANTQPYNIIIVIVWIGKFTPRAHCLIPE